MPARTDPQLIPHSASDDPQAVAPRGRRRSGWSAQRWLTLVAAVAVGLWLVAPALAHLGRRAPSCAGSPLQIRELQRLAQFTGWLQRNDAKGYIGEVGWPSGAEAAEWNDIASSWYAAATRAGLWATVWSASQWWPAGYPMAAYRLPATGQPSTAGQPGKQSEVTERFPGTASVVRGVDIPTGAFGTADDGDAGYSNANPGVPGISYSYESPAAYQFLAQRGVRTVRLSFAWERLQPQPNAPLDPGAVGNLVAGIDAAHSAGMQVILDLHGYGGYWTTQDGAPVRLALGSDQLPASALADFWARLVTALHGVPGIIGYGLMNEPRALATDPQQGADIWEQASQQAVTAIRETGDHTTVMVSGYGGASPEMFSQLTPRAWIHDPAHAVRYEAHQYFDSARSGAYAQSYSQEEGSAASEGYGCQT